MNELNAQQENKASGPSDGLTKQYAEKLIDDRAVSRIFADVKTLERNQDAAQQVDEIAQALEGPHTRWLQSKPVKKVLDSWEQEEMHEHEERFDSSAD
jgi:hypothetical protein